MEMKKVCIFDLDGTLIDTLDSLLFSVNKTLEELSMPEISREQCRAFVGNGARYLIERSIQSGCETYDDSLIEQGMGVYSRVFAEHCMYKVEPYEGMRDVLEGLKKQGVQLAILSNKPHERTVEITEHYFGVGYFDFIQGQCDGIPRKPDPESIYCVIKQLEAEEAQCIYIGDSEVDMMTGEEASVETIGVSWGFRDREVLENTKASAIIDKPSQLLECINRILHE